MMTQNDQFLMNSQTLQDIGSTIVSDTRQLAANLQSFWPQPNSEGRADILLRNLPACLQDDLQHYEQQQKAELDEILQKRDQTGELLSKASDLVDFQKQLSQCTSIDIYKANRYYDGKYAPEYLRAPNSSKSSGTNLGSLIGSLYHQLCLLIYALVHLKVTPQKASSYESK